MSNVKAVLASLKKAGFTGVEAAEYHDSIRLEGEMSSWQDVVKAGYAAVNLGYKGVINDISLKGFSMPPMQVPSVQDDSLAGAAYDAVIIGGGVCGCAIARELVKYDISVLMLEKESDVAMHASSRNDGMIHPGIASSPKKKSAMLNVRGNAMYQELCRLLDVPFERLGNLILFDSSATAAAASVYLAARAKKLGIEGKYITGKKLRALEPNIADNIVGACSYPSSGVLSPYKLTVALAEHAVQNGATVSLETVCTGFELVNGRIVGVKTNRGTVRPRVVINAAGTYSDAVARMAGDGFFTIHPRKGEVAILDKNAGTLVQRSMGVISLKSAHSKTKGGGVLRTIDGNVLVGPDAYEQPYKEDYSTNADHLDAVLAKQLPIIKGLSRRDIITYYAGTRASTYEEDFIVEASDYVSNLVHAAGIQSPGLASAPAIAADIADIVAEKLKKEMELKPRADYREKRECAPVMAKLSLAEKQKLIKKDPDYGVVICRCEQITAGEIKAQLHAPIPALTMDALKRRVRTGMGRCQGGFCTPGVMRIISEQSGIPLTEVTKSGEGSEMAVGATAKGVRR